ncbi:uncharacterized protein LOC135156385 [Lytechinus pictus]|uniref:uncharacterized protein LOC135156385 n=1 Tax=Lytechinus pictus TaxID=7653 RepID=UPI0030B9CED4
MHFNKDVVCTLYLALVYVINYIGVADASNLSCYDCAVKFKQVYKQTDCVVDPTKNLSPRGCQEHEPYCKVEYTKVNRIFTRFVRNCASTCDQRCTTRGFGLDEEVCTFCCNEDGCNLGNRGRQTTSSNISCCIIMVTIVVILGYIF